jgi:KaiC/GvpD/RAD55 family RecA-like ATPase
MQFEKAKKILENLQNRFCSANIYANLMVSRNIEIGEEFSIRLDLANISRNSSLLVRVENLIPQEFKVTAMPLYCISRDSSIEMKERSISPFQIESVKFRLEATKTGTFNLNPQVIYIDDMGETRTCTLNPITMTVKSAQPKYEVLPGRVSIGSEDINALLFGGIPQNFAVALTSSAIDARDRLIRRFLAAGTSAGEATFYITTEAANAKALTEKSPPNFFLFICNPRADAIIESLPNVSKFKGVENLTEIDIALAKVSRIFDQSKPAPKRACIDIVSDVLLQHHAVTTRKWLGGVLADLRAKGFTTLATINPEMHPPEEVQAILGLFDGEMSIYEKETPKGSASFLKVKKMTGQKYLKDEIPLTEE